MRTRDFEYQLPDSLIAQRPLAVRTASRLLQLDGSSGQLVDGTFSDVEFLLRPGDLLVLNDTRVIPARVFARKSTGGRVEILVERVLGPFRFLAQVRASKTPAIGSNLVLDGGASARVVGRAEPFFELLLAGSETIGECLKRVGHTPLPPYLRRSDDLLDRERYQTVFARHSGAVAAPTAGLHFDRDLLQRLQSRGVEHTFITLHVGAGTFQPVRSETVTEHHMHAERVVVSEAVAHKVRTVRERGGRIVAVGTTVVRSLESAAANGELSAIAGDTRLFIYPGYRFRTVDALITNFHLPGSTLLMLVAAFSGYSKLMSAYHHAVRQGYRFFSYGDAMFTTRCPHPDLPCSDRGSGRSNEDFVTGLEND